MDGDIRELTEKIAARQNEKPYHRGVIDRLVIKPGIEKRLADSLETAMDLADGIVTIDTLDGSELVFSEKFACIACGISYAELTPRLFSFNSPHGACPECDGLGFKQHLDLDFIIPDRSKSLRQGAIKPWDGQQPVYLQQMLEALAGHYAFDLDTAFEKLSPTVQDVILYGSHGEKIRFFYERVASATTTSKNSKGSYHPWSANISATVSAYDGE